MSFFVVGVAFWFELLIIAVWWRLGKGGVVRLGCWSGIFALWDCVGCEFCVGVATLNVLITMACEWCIV